MTDEDVYALFRAELYTPVVGDIMDEIGLYHRFLPPSVRPMRDNMVIVGRAMPVRMVDVFGPQRQPFGKLTEALDQLDPGDIYLAAGGTFRCAYWGEILTATARGRGAAGAVIDGYHRDTPQILAQDWPVFSRGGWAPDSGVRTQVADYRCPIEIGGVWIEPGDILFGDIDGVLVVPRAQEAEIIERSLEKARGEKEVLREIQAGLSSTAAFAKYGIL